MSDQEHGEDLELEAEEAEGVTGGMLPPSPGPGFEIEHEIDSLHAESDTARPIPGAPVRAPEKGH